MDKPTLAPRAAPRFVKADNLPQITSVDPGVGDHILMTDGIGAPYLAHVLDVVGDSGMTLVCPTDPMNGYSDIGDPVPRNAGDQIALSDVGAMPDWLSNLASSIGLTDVTSDSAKSAGPGTDAPNSAFANVPKNGALSDRTLPLTKDDGQTLDPKRIKLAWQAVTKGLMGNKAKVSSAALATVKSRILAAANKLPDGKMKDSVLAYIKGKPAAKSIKQTPGEPILREANIAVKAIDGDRVGGYLVIFGDKEHPDLTNEWFTKSTDLCLDWYTQRPILFEHGMDTKAQATMVGMIDTLDVDDLGVWVEGVLDRRNKYTAKVKELVGKGALGWSSGSLSHVVRKRAGEILRWPLAEASLTATPAEPRTLGVPLKHYSEAQTIETAYKAIGLSPDRWLTEGQDADAKSPPRTASGSVSPTAATKSEIPPELTEETMELTPENIAAIAAAIVTAQQATPPTPEPAAAKGLVPGGALPNPVISPAKPVPITVVGDSRFRRWDADTMSFAIHSAKAIESRVLSRRQTNPEYRGEELSGGERFLLKLLNEVRRDKDHKYERELSFKALAQIDYKQRDREDLELLPYKSLADVYAGKFDDAPIKALRQEMLDERNDTVDDGAFKANEVVDTGQSGFGADWVPTLWSNTALRRIRIANVFAYVIPPFDMPSNPFNYPIESTDPTGYYIGETTDASTLVLGSGNTLPISKPGTAKVAVTAKKLGIHIAFSFEENEDSIVPLIPIFNYQTLRTIKNLIDDTIVNGDVATSASTNINIIDGTPGTSPNVSYLAMDGIRKYCLIANATQLVDFGSGAPTLPLFRNMRKTMNRAYQFDLGNLVYVVNPETAHKMYSMAEEGEWLMLGTSGSNVTGLLPGGMEGQVGDDPAKPIGIIDGVPVYVSAQINQAQAGNISAHGGEISTTGSNNTTGTAVLFHRTRLILGYRRRPAVETLATQIFSDTYQMWATTRFGLSFFDTTSAVTGYNIAN
jgi:hypothetical protein